MSRRATTTRRPTAVDLFCGAGGMSLGFEQAGFDVLLGVDLDGYHVAAHERNFPYGRTLCRSVTDLTGDDLRAAVGRIDVDVLFGGPPCQGFSNMGVRDARDPRNTLVGHFVRLVAELQPKAFVMENVPGMLAGSTRPLLDDAIAELESAGYRITHPVRVLDASCFGVPQKRRRLILMGVRSDVPGELVYPSGPQPGQPSRPTVWEAIDDLPDIDADDSLFAADVGRYDRTPDDEYARVMRGLAVDPTDYSHPRDWDHETCTGCLRVRHTPKAVALYAATPPGQMVPGHKLPRLDPGGLAPTLRAGSDSSHGSYTAPRPVHPFRPRCVSAREAARLHGYPDWFAFYPSKWHASRQIGNSVCPPVARAIGAKVMAALGYAPTRPAARVSLPNKFRLPDDRPKTLKRLPQIVHFTPVVDHLFRQAFDPTTKRVAVPRFGFDDVRKAIAETGVNLSWVRADTFVAEIARSRNVRRILESCLQAGYTLRPVDDAPAIGEFVPVGHPDGIDERDFLRVGSREFDAAVSLKGFMSRPNSADAVLDLLLAPTVASTLWPGPAPRIVFEGPPGAGRKFTVRPYTVFDGDRPAGSGCGLAFTAGAMPDRARITRYATATRRDEIAVVVPVTTEHVLATRFSGCLEFPREVGRGLFVLPAQKVNRRTGSARGQKTLF